MNKYSRSKIKAIESHINSIHRGVLGGLTAQQAHANEIINQGVA